MTADSWEVDPRDVVLIGCSASKSGVAGTPRDFYTGDLFQASVKWAGSWGLRWAALSALHGVVPSDRVLEPYNYKLAATDYAIRRLAQTIGSQLYGCDFEEEPPSIVVLAGGRYVEAVRQSVWADRAWFPLQELPHRGIGHYRKWLRENTETTGQFTAVPA